jgi:hypothetical protein
MAFCCLSRVPTLTCHNCNNISLPSRLSPLQYHVTTVNIVTVSDYVPDVVMSSLKICDMNCRGPLREKGGGELGVGNGQFITNQG